MFLFSTIIYFGENPVGYDLYKEENRFEFKPAIDSKANLNPPVLTAVYSKPLWLVEGTEEIEIIQQVTKIIELNQLIATLNVAS